MPCLNMCRPFPPYVRSMSIMEGMHYYMVQIYGLLRFFVKFGVQITKINQPRLSHPTVKPQVVVAGGGFGGLYSALRLSELSRPSRYAPPSIDITLVDRHDRFVFLPLLYELAMGDANEEEVAPRFESLLASTGIRFVQGEVEAIDLAGKCVQVQSQGEATEVSESAVEAPSSGSSKSLAYDKLVLALGSEPMLPPAASLPLSEGSLSPSPSSVMPFYTLRDAHALRRQLMRIDALSSPTLFRTVVVGGGYSGVELAANLATRLGRDKGRVTLVERGYQILGNSPMPVRASAGKRLEEEGVEVMLGVDVVEVDGARVVVRDRAAETQGKEGAEGAGGGGREGEVVLPADLVVWTAGARVSPVVGAMEGLEKDGRGKLVTDGGLRALGSGGDVYVVGDNAAVMGYRGGGPPGSVGEKEQVLPSTAQVAFQESEVAAWNLWSSLTPGAPGPLRFQYTPLGEMLTLGPADATISGLQGMFNLEGPSASLARRLVYIMRMPTGSQRLKAAKAWAKGRTAKVKGAFQEAFAEGNVWQK